MTKIFWASVLAIVVPACSSDDDPPIDCEKSGLIINVDQIIHAKSCSSNDGSIQFSVLGGVEPYEFSLDGQAIEGSGVVDNLTAGVHSLSVTDANSCTFILDWTIMAEDFSFTTTLQSSTSCTTGNGAVTIDVTGDNPPYSFKLGNLSFSPNNFFSGLKSGSHKIAVKDNNDCTVNLSVSIPQDFTGTSWANDIKPILEKECAISGCHNGTSRSNDFRNYNSAKSFATSIKSKTQDRSMPFDGTLTQNQIDLIACWVNDGALQN